MWITQNGWTQNTPGCGKQTFDLHSHSLSRILWLYLFYYMIPSLSRWSSGWPMWLPIKRSRIQILGWAKCVIEFAWLKIYLIAAWSAPVPQRARRESDLSPNLSVNHRIRLLERETVHLCLSTHLCYNISCVVGLFSLRLVTVALNG